MFCRSLFRLLYFFFCPLCFPFFFDIRIMISPLISSNSSYTRTCSLYSPLFRSWLKLSALFNRANIMHMIISVSPRLNISYIMFKIIAFFIITLLARLYARVRILLLCGMHLHGHLISLRGEAWAHKTSYTPPLYY